MLHAAQRVSGLTTLLAVAAFAGTVRAASILVPTEEPTIQAALDVAGDGDTVLVQHGIYDEAVRVVRNGVTIAAADPTNPPMRGAGAGLPVTL